MNKEELYYKILNYFYKRSHGYGCISIDSEDVNIGYIYYFFDDNVAIRCYEPFDKIEINYNIEKYELLCLKEEKVQNEYITRQFENPDFLTVIKITDIYSSMVDLAGDEPIIYFKDRENKEECMAWTETRVLLVGEEWGNAVAIPRNPPTEEN